MIEGSKDDFVVMELKSCIQELSQSWSAGALNVLICSASVAPVSYKLLSYKKNVYSKKQDDTEKYIFRKKRVKRKAGR